MKGPSKEIEHHYVDCHILIQYNFSVIESEFLFTPNFKSISVNIASLFKNITLSLYLGAKIQWVSYSYFFSEIGMEFGLDTNQFTQLSFLSQQHTMFQYH